MSAPGHPHSRQHSPQFEPSQVRIDVWLWAARFFKTRMLAKHAIEAGRVSIEGQNSKPSRHVQVGMRISIERENERFEIEVIDLAERRGPARDARQLYREDAGSIARREAEREQRRLTFQGFRPPTTRPDKKSRRQLASLGKESELPPWWPR